MGCLVAEQDLKIFIDVGLFRSHLLSRVDISLLYM